MIAHLHLLCIGIGHLSILPKSQEGSWNKTIFLCIFPMILIYFIIQFSAAGFCFLVPFYIDPALSTLQYRYVGSIITLMSLLSPSIFVISSSKVGLFCIDSRHRAIYAIQSSDYFCFYSSAAWLLMIINLKSLFAVSYQPTAQPWLVTDWRVSHKT